MGIVTKIKDALNRAQGDVDQLQAKVTHWSGVVEAKRTELAELESGAGERIFGDDSDTAMREYAAQRFNLSASIEGAQAAAQVAETKLRAAQWALASAQAVELRDRAATVRMEAQRRQEKVNAMRAALEEFEGGSWRPWEPTREDVVQAGAAGIPLSPQRTPAMFADAARLDAEAAQLEERVTAERRQAEVIAPTARIVWPGRHYKGQLLNLAAEAGVNDGEGGPVRFEVLRNGQVVHTAALPDGGRRGFRKLINGFHGDTFEVRADGRVIASETLRAPDGEVNVHRGPIIAGYTT